MTSDKALFTVLSIFFRKRLEIMYLAPGFNVLSNVKIGKFILNNIYAVFNPVRYFCNSTYVCVNLLNVSDSNTADSLSRS